MPTLATLLVSGESIEIGARTMYELSIQSAG
jgi:hypothetical protein